MIFARLLALLAVLMGSGCVVTGAAFESLGDLSSTIHVEVNVPALAWISTDTEGHELLNLSVRESVRIIDRMNPVEGAGSSKRSLLEANAHVVVRYRLVTDDDVIPIECVEPFDEKPTRTTIPVVVTRLEHGASAVDSEILVSALHAMAPRRGSALLIWKEAAWDPARDHGSNDKCRRPTPALWARTGGSEGSRPPTTT